MTEYGRLFIISMFAVSLAAMGTGCGTCPQTVTSGSCGTTRIGSCPSVANAVSNIVTSLGAPSACPKTTQPCGNSQANAVRPGTCGPASSICISSPCPGGNCSSADCPGGNCGSRVTEAQAAGQVSPGIAGAISDAAGISCSIKRNKAIFDALSSAANVADVIALAKASTGGNRDQILARGLKFAASASDVLALAGATTCGFVRARILTEGAGLARTPAEVQSLADATVIRKSKEEIMRTGMAAASGASTVRVAVAPAGESQATVVAKSDCRQTGCGDARVQYEAACRRYQDALAGMDCSADRDVLESECRRLKGVLDGTSL